MWVGLSSLRGLYLMENSLTSITKDSWWGGLEALQELRLSSNQLQVLAPGAFSPITGLELLYLDNNQLSQITEAALLADFQGETLHLNLAGNPLQCWSGVACWIRNAEMETRLQFLPTGSPECSEQPGDDWKDVMEVICP